MSRWSVIAFPLFLSTLASLDAHAATCSDLVAKAKQTADDELAPLYSDLVECDKALATESFNTFMRSTNDAAVLVDLSLKAISFEIYEPVWNMLEQIPDYAIREEVAQRVGGLCRDNVGVLPFLRGGYVAMNDREFSMWSEAFVTCPSEELTSWLKSEIASPPSRTYDEKYNTLLTATVKRLGVEAMPPLQTAAVAAAERGGPFTSVLEKMTEAARPGGMGTEMSSADKQRLSKSLQQIGQQVRPEQAALVADRLYQTGHKVEAASLLKVVYGDRVQDDGRLMYGLTITEHCGGEALVHVAAVYEPSKRWSVQDEATAEARRFKKRLKCATDGDWPVRITRSPVRSEEEIDAFAAEVESDWSEKNLAVKIRKEKDIELD